jgi:hypothetical protein
VPVEHALGVAAIELIETITAMNDAIAALAAELAIQFDQHARPRSSPAVRLTSRTSAVAGSGRASGLSVVRCR